VAWSIANAQLTEDLDDLYSGTWADHKKEAIDQIFGESPLWFWLYETKKRVEYIPGGKFIVRPLLYGRNTTFKMMHKGGTIDLSRDEKVTDAIYKWAYAAISLVRYWQEDLQNRGKYQILNQMTLEMDTAKKECTDQLEQQAFGAGVGDDINGLDNIIVAAATGSRGTLGGVDSSVKDWWENQAVSMSGLKPSVWLDKKMRTMLNDCSKGMKTDRPDTFITTQGIYETIEDNTLEQHRIYNKTLGDAQFESIQFKGKPIIWAEHANESKLYVVNSNWIKLIIDPAANFDLTGWKDIPNQVKDRAAQICIALQLICDKRNALGVIYDIT
jgi:hypothetical protein